MQTWEKIRNNPELKEKYLVREEVVDTIRKFFKDEKFHEVQTPTLVPIPSCEPNLEVFSSTLQTASGLKREAFLITSPEYALKKLVAAGLGNVFEITRSFRNQEEVSVSHNPEFTILEWYRVKADYKNIMEDFEKLFRQIINKPKMVYQGQEYDLSLPWKRLRVAEAFEEFSGIDTETLLDDRRLKIEAGKKGYTINNITTWEEVFYQIFFNEIEPELKKLHKPVFIYDYPLAQASLSRKCQGDSRFAERFEVFLAGMELGNCFSELVDPVEQRKRFESDIALRQALGKIKYGIDEDFLRAMEMGMPEMAGIAVGVDRLVMLVADVGTLAETLFFPAGEMFDLSPKQG